MNRIQSLEKELEECKKELKESRDHIFRLQPLPVDSSISPSTLENEYKDLYFAIEVNAERILNPILDNPTQFQNIYKAVQQKPDIFKRFGNLLTAANITALDYENTDTFIVVAVIMRFLQQNIWEANLYGFEDDVIALLNGIEKSMAIKANPHEASRNLATIRTWRSETYHALMKWEVVKKQKDLASDLLANELASILQVFTNDGSRAEFDVFVASIKSNMIKPAVALNEKIYRNAGAYWFNDCNHIEKDPNQHAIIAEWLDNLELFDINKTGKKFVRKDLQNGGNTTDQLKRHLRLLFTMAPAFLYKEVAEEGDKYLDEQILGKPRMLVAWSKWYNADPNKKRNPGLLTSLLSISSQGA